jgi:hypothetical protein
MRSQGGAGGRSPGHEGGRTIVEVGSARVKPRSVSSPRDMVSVVAGGNKGHCHFVRFGPYSNDNPVGEGIGPSTEVDPPGTMSDLYPM